MIHSQIEDPEKVIEVLCAELGLEESEVREKVEKVSSMEKIKTNVDKETGDRIREYDLAGVKVDEDYKRYYPFDDLASRVLGFTGGDNQGIIGLEVKYEDYLKGTNEHDPDSDGCPRRRAGHCGGKTGLSRSRARRFK